MAQKMTKVEQLLVRVSEQQLYVLDRQNNILRQYPVSTSKYGTGNLNGSYQTPLGKHRIKQKIGDQANADEVFIGRQPQGLLSQLRDTKAELPEDIIMARILWLEGLEPGINQGGEVDSYARYIYIHGTSEADKIGKPVSHGCIRMQNPDVMELYDLVEVNCPVLIES